MSVATLPLNNGAGMPAPGPGIFLTPRGEA
jgi:hypothetical protein